MRKEKKEGTMSAMRRLFVSLLIGLFALSTGCGRPDPPSEELAAAKAALEAARGVQADTYAPEAWQRATQALETAEGELEKQSRLTIRRYDNARNLLRDAKEAAETAMHAAGAGRDAAKQEAESGVEQLGEALAEAERIAAELESCTRNPAILKNEVERLTATLAVHKEKMSVIEDAIAGEDFAHARSLGQVAMEESREILASLKEARSRSRC
jgi:hypothetical protein